MGEGQDRRTEASPGHQSSARGRASTDETNRYVLLKVARDVAAQAGDAELAFRAIDAMASRYGVDTYEMKGTALSQAGKSAKSRKHATAIAERALALIDRAVDKDDFVAAKYLGKLALDAARKGRDGQLVKRIVARNKEVEGIAEAYAGIKDALLRLKDNPVDPDANLAVGRYYCFVKGNWDRGLSMLALGSDERLKKLAIEELGDGSTSVEQVALADGWWDMAENVEGAAKLHLQGRAAYWYKLALPGLTGLLKEKVQKCLQDFSGTRIEHAHQSPKDRTGRAVDLLRLVRPRMHAIGGDWKFDSNALSVNTNVPPTRIMLPAAPRTGYRLHVCFTRLAGTNTIGAILPVGSHACVLCVSANWNKHGGIRLVDGVDVNRNSTRVAASIKNGRRYALDVSVKLHGTQAEITAELDGKPLVHWKGPQAALSVPEFWKLPQQEFVGLAAPGTEKSRTMIRFHEVKVESDAFSP